MTTQQAFDVRVVEKIQALHPYLVQIAKGDEDLIQEGNIGIWEAMKKEPEASDGYFKRKAKWNIQTVTRGVGKSIDIPKWYKRKTPIHLVRIDAIPDDDTQLTESVLPDRRRLPLEQYVIEKVDFERFLAGLTLREAGYLLMKMVWEISDAEAAERMDISFSWLRQMKKAIRDKMEDYFAA